jgi:hypothetical protein
MNKQATKKDGNEPLTRKEFNETRKEFNERLDTVDDKFKNIDTRFDKIELALQNQAKAILRNSDDINVVKETMATKDDIQKIITAIDSFAQKSQDLDAKR